MAQCECFMQQRDNIRQIENMESSIFTRYYLLGKFIKAYYIVNYVLKTIWTGTTVFDLNHLIVSIEKE